MKQHPLEAISAYADGELTPAEAARVEAHLATCTECSRELALIKSMGEAMNEQLHTARAPQGTWHAVHKRLTKPIGWLLFVAGVAVWAALAATAWFRDGELTLEWLATTAIGIGLALLLVGIGYEQYREWRTSPYKDVER